MPGILTGRPERAEDNEENRDDARELKHSQSRTSVATTMKDMTTPTRTNQQLYLTGLRGVLVIESFLWTYFATFLPTLTSKDTPGPEYQDILREIFSVPLWNYSFIYNFFIILSMRTIAVSFLANPTGQTYAAAVIRRIVRMVIMLCVASGMATLIFSQIGVQFIDDFKSALPNRSIQTPTIVYDGGAAINSLFDLFWIQRNFYAQAANSFWPTATLWVPSVMYFQSFTVYFLMVILPFTRPRWHISGLFLFGFGSFWMAYWGWYSATGLIFASVANNTALKRDLKRGLKIRDDWHIPYWAIAPFFAGIGIALKYAFIVRPQYMNAELVLHPYLDLLQGYNKSTYIDQGPYARFDDWLIIVAILTVVELFEVLQFALSFKPLVWLGERSFSIFTAQCILFWTGGIKLWLVLYDQQGLSKASANGVVFIVCLLGVAVFSELFYTLVDLPSKWAAKEAYLWLVR